MKIQKMEAGKIWETSILINFGYWLIDIKKEYGYGLLCIHSTCLGAKVGTLLDLKWKDFFINDVSDDYKNEMLNCIPVEVLEIKNSKNSTRKFYEISEFMQKITRNTFINNFHVDNRDGENFVYVTTKKTRQLSTTSLNKELNKLYEQYAEYINLKFNIKLNMRQLKTNAFEIAWGREMIKEYNYSKKVFIEISKYMGHRSVQDTIELLEINPIEKIRMCFDLFNPDDNEINQIRESLNDTNKFYSKYKLFGKINIDFYDFIEKHKINFGEKTEQDYWSEYKNDL